MRFAGVKDLKHQTMKILRDSEKGDIVITAYGKPTAVLHHITEDDFADYLIENDPSFKARIEESFAEYTLGGGVEAGDLIRKLKKRRAKKV